MHTENYHDIWHDFKQGDWNGYTQLYQLFYGPLNNYGIKFTKDSSLIEDAVHDLYVKLWTSRTRLGNPDSVKNYLYKSFRNILFRKISNNKRYNTIGHTDTEDGFDVSIPALTAGSERKDLREQLNLFISHLSPRQQEIVFLRYYEEFSYEEIAEIMSIDINSTYKLLYKALDSLQKIAGTSALLLLLKL